MNCISIDDNPLALKALHHLIDQVDFLESIGQYTDALKALKIIQENEVDLLFLDVEMPNITGLELMDSLENPPLIILVTAKRDYAVDAFEKHVVDYLVKPVALPRFLSAVNFAKKVYESRNFKPTITEHLFVKAEGKWNKLLIKEIKYLQAMGDYVRIFTNSDNYMVNKTMKSLLDSLPNESFVRVHRSYIVNIEQIKNIQDHSIVIDKDVIPISERYKSDFMKRLNLL